MSIHRGFYLNQNKDFLSQLSEIRSKNPANISNNDTVYYNAYLFLHGLCHVFAYVLHQKYGYDILELKNKSESMVHWCCITTYKGQNIYIDIRGITSDFDEFIMEFQPDIGNNPVRRIVTNLDDYDDEWENEQLLFANEIILKYENYYSFN